MSFIERNRKWILGGMILLYVIVLGSVSMVRQYNFQTQAYDMGVFDQTIWNTVQGRLMENSFEMTPNHLGVHMSPLLFLAIPFYAIVSSPYTLLVLQVLALALGAIPLYLLARRMIGREQWALLIAGGYLLYPSLHWVNLFDFHAIAFFVPLMFSAFYFLEAERWRWGITFFIFAVAAKENAAIALSFVGLFFIVGKRMSLSVRKRHATIAVAATLYVALALTVFMPYFGGGFLFDNRYDVFGSSLGEIIRTIITNPALTISVVFTLQKFLYVLFLFLPVLFLPFFYPRALILLIPGLAQNLLATYGPQVSGIYQYDALLIPGLFIGTVYGLVVVLTKWETYERYVFRALGAVMVVSYILYSPVSPVTFPTEFFGTNSTWEAYREIVEDIPDNVSVAAPTNLIPHLTQREKIYLLGNETFPPDIIIVDIADSFGFASKEHFQRYVESYLESGLYDSTLLDERYGILRKL